MTCAKTVVKCTIVSKSGYRVTGTNFCNTPQSACPRAPGEGYGKCERVCDQEGHAEVVTLQRALDVLGSVYGATAYLEGHSYYCQACQEALFGAGVKSLRVGAPS